MTVAKIKTQMIAKRLVVIERASHCDQLGAMYQALMFMSRFCDGAPSELVAEILGGYTGFILANHVEDMTKLGKYHLKPKVVVSGAAETGHCGPQAPKLAMAVGRELARQGCVVVTGATNGVPYYAAMGAKKAGGFVVGLSPATSEREHLKKYRLPIDYHDIIIYTGFEYAGRNLLLTRVGDAVISVCGRMGTLNEFTIAFEERKPIGVLQGSWEIDELIQEIVQKAHRGPGKIVYSKNPRELVAKVLHAVAKEKVTNHHLLSKKYKRRVWGGD
ncbi:MAG: LOG family protein [Parcubacteria group bacterium]|nr:LOG family protein [Parcubacteria group bacterium]